METAQESSPTPECPNCRAALQGRFCHHCGQEARPNLLRVRDFLAEALHEFFSIDGKVPRTLRLFLTSPGKLVREHIEGKRAPYVSPLRLYLLVSLAFFTSLVIFQGGPLDLDSSFPDPSREPRAADRATASETSPSNGAEPEAPLRRRRGEMEDQIRPTAMLAAPPLIALLLMAAFHKQTPYYAAHLALALNMQAFFLFIWIFESPLRWPVALASGSLGTPVDRALRYLPLLLAVPYSLVAMRRVYQVRWRTVLVRGSLVIAGYAPVLLAIIFLVAAATSSLTR